MSAQGRLGPGELLQPAEVADRFFSRGWTDGLPVMPPTEGAVAATLGAGGFGFDQVLGSVPERSRTVTAGKVAVNAVMAGCLPEYFPVVVAAVRAALEPRFNLHAVSSSTGGAAVLILVSGPLAERIGMNSGANAFGPGNRANATIGRTMRLVQMNVLGSEPGLMDASTLGHPGKYTFCIAEAPPPSPWVSLREELGYGPEQTAVLVFPGDSPLKVANQGAATPSAILDTALAALRSPSNYNTGHDSNTGGQAVLVICPEHAESIRDAGWTKDDVRAYVYERSAVPRSSMRAAGRDSKGDGTDLLASLAGPDDLVLVTAGGYGGRWSMLVPAWARRATATFSHAPVAT